MTNIALEMKLYIDGEPIWSATHVVETARDVSTMLHMGGNHFPWRVLLISSGELIDNWYSFRCMIEGPDGTRYTEFLPFLIYGKSAQFPSVLVAPCRYGRKEYNAPDLPRVFVVTAQIPGAVEIS